MSDKYKYSSKYKKIYILPSLNMNIKRTKRYMQDKEFVNQKTYSSLC
jgi:hypothetical protein